MSSHISNIWIAAQKEAKGEQGDDSVMIVVGMKRSGKTTLLYKFVEKNDAPRPTLVLEYSFARRTRTVDLEKDVCHIFELGDGTMYKHALDAVVVQRDFVNMSIILVLNLSVPEEMWFTMDTLLTKIKELVNTAAKGGDTALLRDRVNGLLSKITVDEEKHSLDPFPLPLLIVGTKYDLFQEIESEKRKIICKCLRYLAHINCASLQFVANSVENLMNKMKVTLSHMVFNTTPNKAPVFDYNKPLFIPFGSDSFEKIGPLPDPDNFSVNIKINSLNKVRECFIAYFPQNENCDVISEDPANDPLFEEPELDTLKAQKDKELESFQQMRKFQVGENQDKYSNIGHP